MAAGNINYSVVLADLEARKAELESAIAAIKSILAAGGGGVASGGEGVIDPENIPVGAFLRLSIADATKKFLDMVKTKQSVPQILKALERGGLPPVKYTTLYTVLRRRESQIGDVLRLGDEWALSEWYPNNPNLRKKSAAKSAKSKAKKKPITKKKKPDAKAVSKPTSSTSEPKPASASGVKTHDAAEKVLRDAGGALDVNIIVERVNSGFGKKLTSGLMAGLLSNDAQKRFKKVSDHTWDLAERSEK